MPRADARRDRGPRKLRDVAAVASTAGAFALAALVPKCPLCIAVVLSAWGVGATTAGMVAPGVRPALLAIAAALLVVHAVTRGRARSSDGGLDRHCCSG